MKKPSSSKLRAKMTLFALVVGLVVTNGLQAHGGHVPVESEFLHSAWHVFAGMGAVVAILFLGIFFLLRRLDKVPTTGTRRTVN